MKRDNRFGRGDREQDRRGFLIVSLSAAVAAASPATGLTQFPFPIDVQGIRFRRVRTQFIAALAEPGAKSGDNAEQWGLWRLDPGPRGVRLNRYDRLVSEGGRAPSGWSFDADDWWLEENGLIMEQPEFPLAPGRYLVTGNRDVTTVLTVDPPDPNGSRRWALANDATIYDVTHLRCRSARYTPAGGTDSCSPAQARQQWFPVTPAAAMPRVDGCDKQDYAVLFVIGVADESA
ncbi:MAG TPA: hypothetical protein VIV14_09650 [Gammaproteobacteria bacterium]